MRFYVVSQNSFFLRFSIQNKYTQIFLLLMLLLRANTPHFTVFMMRQRRHATTMKIMETLAHDVKSKKKKLMQ